MPPDAHARTGSAERLSALCEAAGLKLTLMGDEKGLSLEPAMSLPEYASSLFDRLVRSPLWPSSAPHPDSADAAGKEALQGLKRAFVGCVQVQAEERFAAAGGVGVVSPWVATLAGYEVA